MTIFSRDIRNYLTILDDVCEVIYESYILYKKFHVFDQKMQFIKQNMHVIDQKLQVTDQKLQVVTKKYASHRPKMSFTKK